MSKPLLMNKELNKDYIKSLRFYGYYYQEWWAFIFALQSIFQWIFFFVFFALAIRFHNEFTIFIFSYFCVDLVIKFAFWALHKLIFTYKPSHLITYSEKYLFDIPINSWENNDIKNIFQRVNKIKNSKNIENKIIKFNQNLKFDGFLSSYLNELDIIKKIKFWALFKALFRVFFTLFVLMALGIFIFLIKKSLSGAKLFILIAFSIYFCYFLFNYLIKMVKNIQRVLFLKKRLIYLKNILIFYEEKFLKSSLKITKSKKDIETFISLKQYILFDIKEIREIIMQNLFILILIKKLILNKNKT